MSIAIPKPLPPNEYVIVAGYLSPSGPRSASYWACREDGVMEALDRCMKYCERFPKSSVKVVSLDEVTEELFVALRAEVGDVIEVEEMSFTF